MSKKDFNLDEEVEKLAHKSNVDMKKSEYSFENRLRRLDKDIDKIMKDKIKSFDDDKELLSEYLTTDYHQDSIERYREKLKKI